jgi:hypothetical protein
VRQEIEAYQAQGLGQKYESASRSSYKLFFTLGSFFLVLIVGISGAYLLFMDRSLKEARKNPAKDEGQKANLTQSAKPLLKQKTEELKATEWKVKLVPNSGGLEDADVLSFIAGKFVSAKLNSMGFTKSYYSETTEDNGKITWETIQTSADGTASWWGEIQDGRMRGVLSLRQKDKEPQDFSFVSTGYKRKE